MARVLRFRNNDDDVYPLSDDWYFDLSDLRRRLSLSPRYSKNGSNASGDRKSEARTMRFRRTFTATNDTDYITYMNELSAYWDEINGPFFLEDVTNGRRASIECARIASNPTDSGNRYRVENVELEIIMLDAEWEDLIEIEEIEGEIINNGTFEVTNPGKESYPIIELTANADIQEFEIRNLTNNTGFSMSIFDFIATDVIVIDSRTGIISKAGVDITGNIVEGGPPKLSQGTNQFQYVSSSGSVDVVVKWRRVYEF